MPCAPCQAGSIVTILCDSGDRYAHSYYNPAWYGAQGMDVVGADAALQQAVAGAGLPAVAVAVALGHGSARPAG